MWFQSSVDLRSEILKMRLREGPWQNAFKANTEGAGFRFYFVSTALRSLVEDASVKLILEKYLDLCLQQADSTTGLWNDVGNFRVKETYPADADDSNIALFVLLATDFARKDHGQAWWERNASQVKQLAKVVLVANLLKTDLVSIFSKDRKFREPTYNDPKKEGESDSDFKTRIDAEKVHIAQCRLLQKDAYLMDSCEVYAALKALSDALREGDSDKPLFAEAAGKVAAGIAKLFDESFGAFYILGSEKGHFPSFYASDLPFYPYRLAHCFPKLFNVPLFGKDAEKTEKAYERAWAYAKAQDASWKGSLPVYPPEVLEQDKFPMVIRGYIAAIHGDTATAKEILTWYLKSLSKYLSGDKNYVRFASIDEVGYALRLQKRLSGKGTE